MKFFDGNWLFRKGVTPHFACEAYDAEVGPGVGLAEGEIALYCPDRPISGREQTVDGGLLTIRLASPFEGVVRVRISHFEGAYDRGPAFALDDAKSVDRADKARAVREGDTITLTAGPLAARVHRKSPYLIEFLSLEPTGLERRLTSTGERRTAWFAVEGEGSFVAEQLSLAVGELVYGLGERFTPFVKNGQTVDIWNQDGGTSSEQAYKNIPFYLSSAGYGVLVNHPGRVSFEIGTERVARVQFSVGGEELEYFLIYGPGPKEVLARYARLAGRRRCPRPGPSASG